MSVNEVLVNALQRTHSNGSFQVESRKSPGLNKNQNEFKI